MSTVRHLITILLVIISGMTASLFAVQNETLVGLVDENRVLSTPMELHLTSADAPMINSTVSLNHEDAWLFFDNIRPSDVIENYAASIQIDGVQLNIGVNGRIAIYGYGTVIMPHGASFKPLTVYTEEEFGGTSQQLVIHLYHNSLNEFNNAIKSFKLKRGYMATFANKADGSGYSRVFIADKEDLEFTTIPKELYGTTSFIRVFKHQWVNKKGKAGWDPHKISATTYYDWNIGGNSSTDVEYVAIRQNGGWPSWSDINAKPHISHVLGYNEPDRPDQSNMTLQQVMDGWPGMYQSGLRVGSPAWSNAYSNDFFSFLDQCDELNYRVDFVALHCYWGGKPAINWYNDLKSIHDRTGRPLWITEWNNGANWTTEYWPDDTWELTPKNAQKQLNDMTGILQVLDTASFVERYFIYDWVEDRRAMVLADTLTPAGKYYSENKSQIGYTSKNEVIPHWNYSDPELSIRYLTLSNSFRLSWTDSNGEQSTRYKLERKVNDDDYEIVYDSDDITVSSFLDPLNSEFGGTVSYRLSLLTQQGNVMLSNEVSYYQTGGSGFIQFGNFDVNNADWSTAYFSELYDDDPLVILGISSHNNAFPITKRATNITNSRFKFHLEPWAYLNNPVMASSENLAAMTLPSGNYDFFGLKAEANAVEDIDQEWLTVQFDQEFSKVPVVFCSIISNSTLQPLTVAIRNVSKTEFEVSMKPEEAYSGLIFPETINFLAIEPGLGAIVDKRITVGRSEEESGMTSTPVELEYDSSYTEPAFFAGLQSAADDFASTLRYSLTGEHHIDIQKQREFSGGISSMKEDQFGWLVIDLAPGQIIEGIDDYNIKTIHLYPNPVVDVINLYLDQSTNIEIFDLTGQKHIDVHTIDKIDASTLPAGIYVLKAEGRVPAKFIKQ